MASPVTLSDDDGCRAAVAETARMLARMGLVEGFGHVSTRRPGGGFALSSTGPLGGQEADDVLLLDADGALVAGDPARRPLEAPMHAAVYAARADVGAVCRTHSPEAARWACRPGLPPLVHGLGGLAGAVARYDDVDLVATPAAGAAVVDALDDAACLLLGANGVLCCGPDLAQATVRAWYLEERCAFATALPEALEITGEPFARRSRHFDAERRRAWQWLSARYGAPAPYVAARHS